MEAKETFEKYYIGGITYLPGTKTMITEGKDFFYEDKDTKPRVLPYKKEEIKYIPWGQNNIYPNEVIQLVEKNPVASTLLDFKTELTYGSGIKIGRKVNGEFVEYTVEEKKNNEQIKQVADLLMIIILICNYLNHC